jgi:hypothetical protein
MQELYQETDPLARSLRKISKKTSLLRNSCVDYPHNGAIGPPGQPHL